VLLQALSLRTISDECQPYVGENLNPCPERLDVLFCRKTTDIKKQRACGVSIAQSVAHLGGAAITAKQIGIDAARPKCNPLDSMLLELPDHQSGRTQANCRSAVAYAKNLPDVAFEEAKTVVVQILRQVGMVRNDNGQMHGSAVLPAAIIKCSNAQQCRISHMKNVGLELCKESTH